MIFVEDQCHDTSRHDGLYAVSLKCGEWTYLFATIVEKVKMLLDIADLESTLSLDVDT